MYVYYTHTYISRFSAGLQHFQTIWPEVRGELRLILADNMRRDKPEGLTETSGVLLRRTCIIMLIVTCYLWSICEYIAAQGSFLLFKESYIGIARCKCVEVRVGYAKLLSPTKEFDAQSFYKDRIVKEARANIDSLECSTQYRFQQIFKELELCGAPRSSS